MGVHGLWQLLQTAGQPVTLESLEGKILAVDVSIWLHQTMKGMRDKDGNPLPNAHLQGLFSRICKLLFYRIKPVFIFDGGVPVLKKQTMAVRRERKAEAERESTEISEKLLQNLIKSQAVQQTIGSMDDSRKQVTKFRKDCSQTNSDMFELPPLAESEKIGLAVNAEEWDRDFEVQEQWIKEGLAAISDRDPDSEEFRTLPMEIQHEILNELREKKKYHSLSRIIKMPEDSTDFSFYQLQKLMTQSKLTNRIEEVRKHMTMKTSGDLACGLEKDYHGDEVEARRIVSEDAAHYILIKGLTKRMQQEEADKYEIHNRVKLEKVEEENDEDYLMSAGPSSDGSSQDKDKSKSAGVISLGSEVKGHSSDSDSGGESVMARRLSRKRHQKSKTSQSVKNAKIIGKLSTLDKGVKQIVGRDDDEQVLSGMQHYPTVVSCSSHDEGFIEVRIDPSVATEDDLFPASIFQTNFDDDGDGSTSNTGSTFCHSSADNLRSDENQIKNDLTQSKLNISPGMQQTTVSEHQYKDLEETANSSKALDEKKATLINSVSVKDDITTKRKNVLNEILLQLEERKKHLNDLQADMDADPFFGGHFIEEHLSEKQKDTSMGNDENDASFFTSASGLERIMPDSMKKSSYSPMVNVAEEASYLSESDEDLKIAIELSLQTAKSREEKSLKTSFVSQPDLRENTLSVDLIKHNNVETDMFLTVPQVNEQYHTMMPSDSDSDGNTFVEDVPELSFMQNTSKTAENNESAHNNKVDLQKHAVNSDLDRRIGSESNLRASMKGQSENLESQSPLLPTPDESGQKLSNEIHLESYGIDFEKMQHSVNENELKDIRTRLDSERSALMSERGRHTRLAASITEQTNMEAQELLRLFGIPFIISPMEAEAQCAHLNVTNQIQGTITDDSDIWLFGGSHVYKNFFNQSRHVEFYTFENIHKHFGLSRKQLINIALLCGSDYTEGISGVGPVRALEIMAEFPGEGLEGLQSFRKWWDKAKSQISANENKIRAWLKDLKIIPGFPSQAVVDAYLYPQVDESTDKFTWGKPDLDMLREFAKYKFGWSKEKCDQSLLPMIKQLSKRESQSRIHSYFQQHHFTQNSKIKSQRLKNALAIVNNSKKTIQQEDNAEDDLHDNSVTEVEMMNTSGEEKICKKMSVGENNVDDFSNNSEGNSIVTVSSKKKKIAEKSSKKSVRAIAKRMKKRVNIELAGNEVQSENVQDTKRSEFEIREAMKTNQLRKEAMIKHKKDLLLTSIKNTRVKEHRVDFVGEENEKKKEVLFEDKLNQSQKDFNERLEVVQNTNVDLEKCRTEREGKTKTVKGRGKIMISLDSKQRKRVRNFGSKAPNLKIVRDVQNLSASSDNTDSSDDNEQSKLKRYKAPTTLVKQRESSRHMLSTETCKDCGDGHVTCIETHCHDKVVEIQVPQTKDQPSKIIEADQSLQNPSVTVSKSLNAMQTSTRKKIYQERVNTIVMSAKLTSSIEGGRTSQGDNFCAEQEHNVDMMKADVSIINKQYLASTLTYLNHRSKEDQLLLQCMKHNKGLNVVEKRLEDIEKRSQQERQKSKTISQAAEQGLSFADILGSVDAPATKNFQSKVQKLQNYKKPPKFDDRDKSSQAKIFQEKILQQIGQFGTTLVGASSKNELDPNVKQASFKVDNSSYKSNFVHTILPNDDGKRALMNEVKKHTVHLDLSELKELDEKTTFTMPVQNIKTFKSNRSKAFDEPIDIMSDCSSDTLNDSGSGKLSKKKFLKQMEHLGDPKSVKGHGPLPRQYTGQVGGGKAFSGKGKGRGKNRNYLTENTSGRSEYKNVSEQEILDYVLITADDLGSDFSDCEV